MKSQGTKFSETKTEDTPTQEFLYYKDMTRDNARLASEWVKENMSKQAQDIVLDYEVVYGKSTISAAAIEARDKEITERKATEKAATGPKQQPTKKDLQEFDLRTVKGEDTTREIAERYKQGQFLENAVASLELRLLRDWSVTGVQTCALPICH